MAAKEVAVKKYVVRLSADERVQLETLIRAGKRPAQLLTKARILLKADVSAAGDGWSDSRVAAALDTSIANIERTRRQLVEEGFEVRVDPQIQPNSARPRIFDGAAEAKLIATACSQPRTVAAAGRCTCWQTNWWSSKSLLPSHECVRTTLKKTNFSRIARSNG